MHATILLLYLSIVKPLKKSENNCAEKGIVNTTYEKTAIFRRQLVTPGAERVLTDV